MYWTEGTRSINVGNNYSKLKYPLAFASVLTTILALLLLLSFRSNDWFHYELVYRETNSSTPNQPSYAQLLEFGTVGLWKLCIGHYDDPHVNCEPWTNENRPHSFNTLIVLVSCALFLANLTVFPSWAASILILYNTNNRYIRSILGFIWILVILTFSYALLLLVAILISCLSRFYAPGVFSIGSQHLFFHSGSGLFYMGFGKWTSMLKSEHSSRDFISSYTSGVDQFVFDSVSINGEESH